MSWDWQVFCEDTLDREVVQGCFGKGGDVTYLDWLLSAWGWTISVSLLGLLLALLVGTLVGTARTLEGRPWLDQRDHEYFQELVGGICCVRG